MIPVLLFYSQKNKLSKKFFKYLALGTLFIIGYNLMFFVGLKVGYAGLGGVIVTASNPLITFGIIAFIEKVRITLRKKIALLLGLIGGIIMLRIWEFHLENFLDSGNLFFILASLLWSLVTLVNAKAREFVGSLTFTFYLYIASSFASFWFTDIQSLEAIFEYDLLFWVNLFFATVISTGFATTLYFKASTILGAGEASSFIFIVPLVALGSSSLLLGEIPLISTVLGGCLAIFAVYLLNTK